MIVINPDKVTIISTMAITTGVMKNTRLYVKTIGKLKISELIS
jgi:hypothetical protein